jgi:hypothetical protein
VAVDCQSPPQPGGKKHLAGVVHNNLRAHRTPAPKTRMQVSACEGVGGARSKGRRILGWNNVAQHGQVLMKEGAGNGIVPSRCHTVLSVPTPFCSIEAAKSAIGASWTGAVSSSRFTMSLVQSTNTAPAVRGQDDRVTVGGWAGAAECAIAPARQHAGRIILTAGLRRR